MYKSPTSFGAYKYLLIYISLFELVYATLDVLVSPELYTYRSSFMLVLDSNKTFLPFWMLYPIDLLFCGMLGCSMAIFTINFVYRYLVMKGSDLIKSFESSKLFFWIASPIVYSAIWMFITAVTLQGNKFTDVMLEEQVLRKQNISLSEIVYIGPNYYPQKEVIDWVPILGMATLTLMIFVSIYSIIYFAAKSYIAMNKLVLTSKNSQRYKASQAQLLNALVIQAIIPFVLMHLPASAVFIMPFFSCGNQTFASIFSVTVALYPVLDPLPTIFVVKCYRVAVTQYLSKICSLCKFHSKVEGDLPSSTSYQSPTIAIS
ncbi:hypothetical protein L5515_011149 [Caenorhabditis briggsae]|uniref:Seven TM Receptor n=1 Tax=Caenorhabditis briggsae TaxID=6238 RepID=A0AAE9JGV1_CAEBR|nr:hypothetical protein L5515_011149 [Caenorhabditis briggsae]